MCGGAGVAEVAEGFNGFKLSGDAMWRRRGGSRHGGVTGWDGRSKSDKLKTEFKKIFT